MGGIEGIPTNCVVFLCFIGAAVVLVAGYAIGYALGVQDQQRKAVKANAAKWISSEEGSPTFMWNITYAQNPPPPPLPPPPASYVTADTCPYCGRSYKGKT